MTQITKKKLMDRLLSIVTLSALFIALSATGVLATFFRGISAPFLGSSNYVATTDYGYGYGYDDVLGIWTDDFGYTYSTVSTSGGGGSGGGSSSGGSGSSSSKDVCTGTDTSGSFYDGKCEKDSTVTDTSTGTTDTSTGTTDIPTTPSLPEGNENNQVDGSDSADTIRNEGNCSFPNPTVNYDDTSGNWAEAYIRDLSKRGIMNGNSSGLLNPVGTFEPNRATTRIEFLKIALRSFCYEYNDLAGTENFADVIDNSWQARVIQRANSLSIINAANTNFRPNDAISRIEAMKMILKVGETRSSNFTLSTATTTTFTDIPDAWMVKYVETAKNLAIVSATNTLFRPLDAINRGETAKVAVRSMNAQ